MNKEKPDIQIILIVTKHPVFGYMLVPYTANKEDNGTLRILEQATHTDEDTLHHIEEAGKQACRIASQFSDKHLMQVYSREKRISEFLKKVPDKVVQTHIRPFIEKKTRQLTEIAQQYGLPVYQNEPGNKVLYSHSAYSVPTQITELHFCFTADEKTFSYSLKSFRNNKEISLREKKPVITLTQYPATLCLGSELLVFRDIEANRIIPFTNKDTVSVDVSETDKYLEKVVLPVIQNHDVTTTGLPVYKETVKPEPLATLQSSLSGEPVIQLTFRYDKYDFYPNQPGEKMAYITEENGKKAIRYFYRDTELEDQIVSILSEHGLCQIDEKHFGLSDQTAETSLIEWIRNHRFIFEEHIRLSDFKTGADYYLDDFRMEKDVTQQPDWFDIHITVHIGQFSIPFVRFRRHILNRKREYILPDGKIAILPEKWFEAYSDLIDISEDSPKDNETIRIKRSYIGLMNAAFKNDNSENAINYRPKQTIYPPRSLKAELRPYQLDGFNWMVHLYENGYGGCLADDMGLGKTLQTLTLLQYIYQNQESAGAKDIEYIPTTKTDENGNYLLFDELTDKNTIEPVHTNYNKPEENQFKPASLVVMPTSLLHNWRKEIARFTTLSVYEFTGAVKLANLSKIFNRHHIILTSYGIMRNHIEQLRQYTFEYIVLDESQYIKNSDSITFKSAVQLSGNRKLVLTGTPIENSLKDLWSQFYFIQPGLLGTETDFQKRFIMPVKQNDCRAEKKLRALIEPFFLRRRKEQVAPELPPLIKETIYCDMSPSQRENYEREKNNIRRTLLEGSMADKYKSDKLNVLNALLKLRQIAMHPILANPEFTDESGKLDMIQSAYETIRSEGHKVLIFSSFVEHLKIIGKAFEEKGWEYTTLTGSTSDREKEVERFTKGQNIGAFLISIKAGGTGLNLIGADYVFIIDPWWNPAVEMQAVSRAHRIGQNKPVFSYRFITQDTIEEKMLELQENKKKLADTFINDNDPLSSLSDDEWEKLLS